MRYSTLKLYVLSGIILLLGVCVGSGAACLLSQELCEDLIAPITGYGGELSRTEVVLNFAGSALKPVIVMWVFGLTRFSIFANILALVYRGTVFGVIFGALYRMLGTTEGLVNSLICIFPQNILYIGVLLSVSVWSYEYSICKISTKRLRITYFGILAVSVGICFICGFFDAFITATFLGKEVDYAVFG